MANVGMADLVMAHVGRATQVDGRCSDGQCSDGLDSHGLITADTHVVMANVVMGYVVIVYVVMGYHRPEDSSLYSYGLHSYARRGFEPI